MGGENGPSTGMRGCASGLHSGGPLRSSVERVTMEVSAMTRFAFAGLAAVLGIAASCCIAAADTTDQALFTAVAPDAMLVLDLSGSMRWNPKGEIDASQEPILRFGNDICSGETFSDTPRPGLATDCARYLIAKRAIHTLLDDNRDGVIDGRDETGLDVRLGFWTFGSGSRKRRDIGRPYAEIWCGAGACPGSEAYAAGENSILYWTDRTLERLGW